MPIRSDKWDHFSCFFLLVCLSSLHTFFLLEQKKTCQLNSFVCCAHKKKKRFVPTHACVLSSYLFQKKYKKQILVALQNLSKKNKRAARKSWSQKFVWDIARFSCLVFLHIFCPHHFPPKKKLVDMVVNKLLYFLEHTYKRRGESKKKKETRKGKPILKQ